MNNKIIALYNRLLKLYNTQGWWPLLDCEHLKQNPTKSGSMKGYHPGDYSFPKTEKQLLEICIGAILTQNTSWQNVEKALRALDKENSIDARRLLRMNHEKLAELIRPAGYYNQKAKKLKIFTGFYISLNEKTPSRQQLLDIWGIGPETADSILLYAYQVPTFVVDAYTRRILIGLKMIRKDATYDDVKKLFEKNLPKDYKIYQEYHALLVEHAKRMR